MIILLYILYAFLAALALFLMGVVILSLTVDKKKPIQRQSKACRWVVANIIGVLCALCGIRTRINGEELLPENSRFLMISNHRSFFDPLVIMDRLRRFNISFVSKPGNMDMPVIGSVAYGAGFLAIDRENNREALKTILQAADYLKKDFCSMAIYPEGTRCKNGGMLPFHAGSLKIAQKANVPLVISAIRGTENVKHNMLRRRTDVVVDILQVIPAAEVKAQQASQLSEYSRNLIMEHLDGFKEQSAARCS